MRSPTVSGVYLASMMGLGAVALAFACDGTTTNPTPDLAVFPDLSPVIDMTTLVPAITTVAPALGNTAGNTSVTITGSGFTQGATVKIGTLTVSNPVVSADGTTITFMTPANLGKPGAYDVIVTNSSGQSATKTAGYTYFITVAFAAGANVTQGSDRGPRFVTPYDIDNDGTLDLAVAYANGSTLVTYKGTSAGANITFGAANSVGVNTYPFMVSVGDVNGDGKADLVAPCQNSTGQGSVAVLLGSGAIGPGALVTNNVGIAAQKPQWTQLVDVNGV